MVRKFKDQQQLNLKGDKEPILYQSKMMRAVSWLLPFEWVTDKEVVYQRGSGASLRQWLDREPKREEVLKVVEAYAAVQSEVEQYLMDQDKFLWDPDWIYWDGEKEKLQLIYCPWDDSNSSGPDLLKRIGLYLWNKSICNQWKEEALLLLICHLNMAAQQNAISLSQWLEKERKSEDKQRVQEEALDILMEKDSVHKARGWFQSMKEKFPFAFR